MLLRDMQMSWDERCDSEAFFDPAECLSIEESDVSDTGSSSGGYSVWLSELQSVEQRRKVFLRGMGLAVSCSSDNCPRNDDDLLQVPDTDRLTDSSEAVSSTSLSSSSFSEACSTCSRNEVENYVASQLILEAAIQRKDQSADPETKPEKQNDELSLWKLLLSKIHRNRYADRPRAQSRESGKTPTLSRIKAHHNKKRMLELSALFSCQDIQAHDGSICAMKFSPDGHYLATGGEDGNICIWKVTSVDASSEEMNSGPEIHPKSEEEHPFCKGKIINQASVLKPNEVFWVDESPVQVLRGHSSDILDLAWSSSNKLLSSSKDYTVRLWQVGSDACQGVFHHGNYVTCVQFNPVDDDYLISGSIDGKARVWRVSTQRVVDWADVRDAISAICYRPHGKGFAVGTIAGACHFYETTGSQMQRDTTITIPCRRKKHLGNKITSIEISKDISGRVLIASQDSKVRVFDGNDIIYQFKGPRKSGSQMSASFTSTGKHMVSVGDDSCVYLWNQSNYTARQNNAKPKSVTSCEHFYSEGASVMLPWHGSCNMGGADAIAPCSYKDNRRFFSMGKWFSQEGQCRTWPEEVLPPGDEPGVGLRCSKETWGLVFVTGSRDGKIRTFHNYGLPVRL